MSDLRPLRIHELVEDKVIEKDYGKSVKPFNLFSPSQVGYCKRQMYNRKMDLTVMDRYVKGILHAGTVNHFWLEHNLPGLVEDRGVQTERRVRTRVPVEDKDFDLFVYGEADVVDSAGYVYDHKFTGDASYRSDGPKKKDKRQVNMYIYGLDDVHTGQLEYVTRDGKFGSTDDNVNVHTFEFDEEEFERTKENMAAVAEKVRLAELKGTEHINPFDKCEEDCFFCDNEEFKPEVREKLGVGGPSGNVNDS
jgi:hypothetical protein